MDKPSNIMKVSADVFLLLGSNMGNRTDNIKKSKTLLEREGLKILKESAIYETAPWGNTDQNSFLNQAIQIQSGFFPEDLLSILQLIENEIGRTRVEKWGPRVIDIDILLFGNEIVVKKNLKIPHPEMHNRKFALMPLNEIAGNILHPVLNLPVSALLNNCNDTSWVKSL